MPSIESLSSSICKCICKNQSICKRENTTHGNCIFGFHALYGRVWDGSGKENVTREKHCANNLSTKTQVHTDRPERYLYTLQGVKIPIFPLTLLVIVATVLHYRAACDAWNSTDNIREDCNQSPLWDINLGGIKPRVGKFLPKVV